MMQGCDWQKRDLFVAELLTSKCCSVRSSVFTDYTARKTNGTSSVVSFKNHDNSSCWGITFDQGKQNLVRVSEGGRGFRVRVTAGVTHY